MVELINTENPITSIIAHSWSMLVARAANGGMLSCQCLPAMYVANININIISSLAMLTATTRFVLRVCAEYEYCIQSVLTRSLVFSPLELTLLQ